MSDQQPMLWEGQVLLVLMNAGGEEGRAGIVAAAKQHKHEQSFWIKISSAFRN